MSHLIVITSKLLRGRCEDYSTYTRTLFGKLGRNSKTLVARYLRPPDVNPRHIRPDRTQSFSDVIRYDTPNAPMVLPMSGHPYQTYM